METSTRKEVSALGGDVNQPSIPVPGPDLPGTQPESPDIPTNPDLPGPGEPTIPGQPGPGIPLPNGPSTPSFPGQPVGPTIM